jgi:hypothetical protein
LACGLTGLSFCGAGCSQGQNWALACGAPPISSRLASRAGRNFRKEDAGDGVRGDVGDDMAIRSLFALVVLKKIRESGVASFCEQPNHL